MGFLNSLSIRISLAVIGGILYALLTYSILILLNLSSGMAIFAWVFVFLFYLGSRVLILFSGIDSPYYSRKGKAFTKPNYDEKTSFFQTTQWVGKLYHYHDIALFVFLTLTAITFLTTSIIDGLGSNPIGTTIQGLLSNFIPPP